MSLPMPTAATDLEQELDHLIERYETAAATADAARAEYHALRESPPATLVVLQRARAQWRQAERARATLRRALDLLEDRAGA